MCFSNHNIKDEWNQNFVRLLGFMYHIYMIFHGNCLKHCNILDYCVFASGNAGTPGHQTISYIRHYNDSAICNVVSAPIWFRIWDFWQFWFSRFDNSKVINQIEEQLLWILMKHIQHKQFIVPKKDHLLAAIKWPTNYMYMITRHEFL